MLGKICLAVMTLVTTTMVGGCSYDYEVQMGIKKDGILTSVSTSAPLMPVEETHLQKTFGKPEKNTQGNRLVSYPGKLMSGIWEGWLRRNRHGEGTRKSTGDDPRVHEHDGWRYQALRGSVADA